MVVPAMLAKYFPNGLLGIGLTALMASFMSGMAGNVKRSTTVFTYDLYQSYIIEGKRSTPPDRCRVTTVVGLLVSAIGSFNRAPVRDKHHGYASVGGWLCKRAALRDVLLGMFWRREHWARRVLWSFAGTLEPCWLHGFTLPVGEDGGHQGRVARHATHLLPARWLRISGMAIVAFTSCFLGTIAISLATRPIETDAELRGLVIH